MCREGAVSELAARVTGVVFIRRRVCSLAMGRAVFRVKQVFREGKWNQTASLCWKANFNSGKLKGNLIFSAFFSPYFSATMGAEPAKCGETYDTET